MEKINAWLDGGSSDPEIEITVDASEHLDDEFDLTFIQVDKPEWGTLAGLYLNRAPVTYRCPTEPLGSAHPERIWGKRWEIAMTDTMLYQLIAECERWVDQVEPAREGMSETAQAWRLGFAAAMQRVEIYGRQMVAEQK
jgi:hypothetical protein